jgi:DNA repair exonuclease SbcCD ATPase subunit
MQINKLILKNFKLFKSANLDLSKINIITGVNGAGKSTILKAILYALYGEGCGNVLTDLISFGEKSTEVKIDFNQTIINENKQFTITRKIPSNLEITVDGKEVQYNTNQLKQHAIDNQIGDFIFFKKYRLLTKQSINLLDLGIVSLRKELMQFIEGDFASIRQSLLNKKLERENFNINKKLYKFYLSTKRQSILESGLLSIETSIKEECSSKNEQSKIVNNLNAEIQTKERMIYNRRRELEEAQKSGTCPILKKKCTEITKSITPEQQQKINIEINAWQSEIEGIKEKLLSEQDYLNNLELGQEDLNRKKHKAQSYIMKYKEAQKFSDYKYTLADITLYSDAIKTFDSFAGWYIQNWLDNLVCILNDLLKEMNISVTFSADKQFITVKDGNQEMKYEQLSDGQQVFLNLVLKVAILLNNGINNGIILIDDSVNFLMIDNFKKLIEVLKQTPFQVFAIYQNVPNDLQDVNYIHVERNEKESKII